MRLAYKTVPLTKAYLDVIEREMGPKQLKRMRKEIDAAIDETSKLCWLIFDYNDVSGNGRHVIMPADDIYAKFYTTIGENDAMWAISKKTYPMAKAIAENQKG